MTISLSRYDPSRTYRNQKTFDCGHRVINEFVSSSLKQQVQKGLSVAYVIAENDLFVGFCTVMAASVSREALAVAYSRSLPKAVPVTKLSMLGVAKSHSGRGHGKQLLREAIRAMVQSSTSVGTMGLYLETDPDAYLFYVKHSFVPLIERQLYAPTPMFLSLATVQEALGNP